MCNMSPCTSLVQGKEYFKCPDNYGIFVRQSQIAVIEDTPSLPTPSRGSAARSSIGGASSIPLVSSLKKEKVINADFDLMASLVLTPLYLALTI